MNFVNPYISVYYNPESLHAENKIPFYKEVCWVFLKNLDNRLKLFKHRLNIEIVDTVPLRTTMKFGSIYGYILKLDKPFNKIIESEKRRKFLDIVYEAFMAIGVENNWDLDVIEDTYKKSLTQIDRFEYLTEGKLNRTKKNFGQIELTLNGNCLTVHAVIHQISTNQKEKIKLIDTDEGNLSWSRMFKEFGWLDNTKFGLKFLSGDLWIVLNIENGQIEEFKRPKSYDLKKIEDYLENFKKPWHKNT